MIEVYEDVEKAATMGGSELRNRALGQTAGIDKPGTGKTGRPPKNATVRYDPIKLPKGTICELQLPGGKSHRVEFVADAYILPAKK